MVNHVKRMKDKMESVKYYQERMLDRFANGVARKVAMTIAFVIVVAVFVTDNHFTSAALISFLYIILVAGFGFSDYDGMKRYSERAVKVIDKTVAEIEKREKREKARR